MTDEVKTKPGAFGKTRDEIDQATASLKLSQRSNAILAGTVAETFATFLGIDYAELGLDRAMDLLLEYYSQYPDTTERMIEEFRLTLEQFNE